MKKTTLFILFFFALGIGLAQNPTSEGVLQGVNLFYEARFDQSYATLQSLIAAGDLAGDDLFTAHLYSAFCLIRTSAPQDSVDAELIRAIYVNPRIVVDKSRIPPDLYEQYLTLRMKTVGGLVIYSKPSAASVIMYHQNSDRIFRYYTPVELTDLIAGGYELVVAKEGFLPKTALAHVLPNRSDTLVVELEEKEISMFKKYWPWAGGFFVATSLLLSQLFDEEPQQQKPKETLLPEPPQRPTQP